MQQVTLVAHRPGWVEQPWLCFLLGPWAGEVVDDPDRQLVVPYSVMVTDRPDLLKGRVLAAVRRLGTVGLLHISDRRYRCSLEPYRSFGFVWRTYYHSGLSDWAVRQLPLGPALLPDVTAQPSAPALRPPAERLYTWSFAGDLSGGRNEMIDAFRQIDGGQERLMGGSGGSSGIGGAGGRGASGGVGGSQAPGGPGRTAGPGRQADDAAVLEALADSVFVPCAGDGVHLESHRIYEALELGAIPIVERRRRLDYFHELLGEHPLPTVRSWSEASVYVRRLLADQRALAALHQRVVAWWTEVKASLAQAVQDDVARCFADSLRGFERSSIALDRPAPRWRGQVETLRHRGLRPH